MHVKLRQLYYRMKGTKDLLFQAGTRASPQDF